MSWCPNCREEYEEHVKTCPECQSEIVNELPEEVIEEQEEMTFNPNERIEKLCNVASSPEAAMIKSILQAYQIPVMFKSKGSGDYLQIISGVNYQGVDVYVPSSLLEKAKSILETHEKGEFAEEHHDQGFNDEEYDEMVSYDRQVKSKARFALRLLLIIVIFIPILMLVIMALFNLGGLSF